MTKPDYSYDLGFIGAGNMAEAIVRAAINQNIVSASRMLACDPSAQRRDMFASLGLATTDDITQVVSGAQSIMLAVKPQTLPEIGEALAGIDVGEQIVISIMAGIGSQKIADASHCEKLRVVRVMPNTPLMAGAGMAGIALGAQAQPGDEALAMQLFGAAGQAILVDEAMIDAVTAVSGSGPAYLFYLAEAMERAAGELGLGEHARLLVAQTLLGSAKLLLESTDTPAELRRKVTSPGGTTEAAIKHMQSRNLIDTVTEAIHAAQQRSIELGKN